MREPRGIRADESTDRPTVENLRDCLVRVLPLLPENPKAELFKSGVIDSLSLIEVVVALEETFSITFKPQDMSVQNFSTLEQILGTVNRIRSRNKV